MHLLPTSLAQLADLADKKNTGGRFALSGVRLRVHGDNSFVAEATDTKVLLRVSGPCVAPSDEYPEHPGLKDAPNGSTEALIPAATWAKVFSSAAKTTKRQKEALQSVAVKLSKEVATFGSTDLDSYPVEQTRLIEGRFPPAADIIGQIRKRLTRSVWVDPVQMARALKAIAAVGCDEDNQGVEILLTDDPEKPFIIQAKRANGVNSELVIMPLSGESSIKETKDTKAEEVEEETPMDQLREELARVTAERDRLDKEFASACREVELQKKDVLELQSKNEALREELQSTIKAQCDQPHVEVAQRVPLSRRERLQRIGA